MKLLLTLLILLMVAYFVWRFIIRGVGKAWHRMHEAVGIEVGTSRHALPSIPLPRLSHQPSVEIPNSFGSDERYQLVETLTNVPTWRTKHGKIPPMPQLAGVTIDRLNLMPTEAVVILDRINDKLTRYNAWRQQYQADAQASSQTQVLTEKQFVIDRLIGQTIPEAVNQYDQLARFNPYQLQQPIHDSMTAGDILIAVLQQVDGEFDALINELQHQVSNQLATTYRYVKARTQ